MAALAAALLASRPFSLRAPVLAAALPSTALARPGRGATHDCRWPRWPLRSSLSGLSAFALRCSRPPCPRPPWLGRDEGRITTSDGRVGRCAPRFQAFQPARSGARGRLALDRPGSAGTRGESRRPMAALAAALLASTARPVPSFPHDDRPCPDRDRRRPRPPLGQPPPPPTVARAPAGLDLRPPLLAVQPQPGRRLGDLGPERRRHAARRSRRPRHAATPGAHPARRDHRPAAVAAPGRPRR